VCNLAVFSRPYLVVSTVVADRTYCAVALMLQCCVCLSSVRNVLWLNSASYSKSYYWHPIGSRMWEIDWYQNEWPWSLFRGRLRSCQPLRHIRHWISRKPVEIKVWFQKTINRKRHMGIKWSRDLWRHVNQKGQTRDSNTLRTQYLENSWRCYLATIANY